VKSEVQQFLLALLVDALVFEVDLVVQCAVLLVNLRILCHYRPGLPVLGVSQHQV
jgi:hypothetical protein